jgi:hypothetical protein
VLARNNPGRKRTLVADCGVAISKCWQDKPDFLVVPV